MKTAVIGIGNPIKKDDNIGNIITDKLKEKIKDKNFTFLIAQLTPENYLAILKETNPEKVYIIDAVDFEGKTGEVKVFSLDDIELSKITTHSIPINVFKEYLPSSEIKLIGIKVEDVNFGEELSTEINSKLREIIVEIEKIIF